MIASSQTGAFLVKKILSFELQQNFSNHFVLIINYLYLYTFFNASYVLYVHIEKPLKVIKY